MHANGDMGLQRIDRGRIIMIVGSLRHRAVEEKIGIGAMKLVAGRLTQIRKRAGDLLNGLLIAAFGGKIGRRLLDRQAELVAALNVGDRLDR